MAVLKYIPKSGQAELTEHLQKEIKLVTQGKAKYYNRLYKFFLQTDVMSSEDIDYEVRERYIEWIKQEDISEKYKAELIRLFDRMKIENMPDIQTQGVPFAVTQDFFQKDKWFLLYVPNKQKARTFRQVVNKEELLWDFSTITSQSLKKQAKTILCEILNMPIAQRMRRRYLEPLKILISFCQTQGIDDIEEMDTADENRFYMYISQRSKEIKRQGSMIVEFSRRTLFLADSDTNWNASVWYLERFRFDMSRVNVSSPIRSISFTKIQIQENRKNLQLYGKYLVGISDMAISNIRTTIGFLTQFLLYLDDRGMALTELVAEDIHDYAVYLGTTDIKYSTVNRYIMSIHTFFQFLQMKKVDVPQFYPEQYLQKGYSEHNDRSVPERTVVQILNALPTFPEHLQLMYLILLCTGIRKSEVCTIKGGAFYKQNGEFWLRIYQPKMRRDKVIPVPSVLLEIVKEYEKKNGIKVGEYIFKNARGDAFNGQTFSNQMIEECEKRDINCGEYVFRAHDYRHSIATIMHEKGVAIQGIRDYLGHSSENMTKQYIDFMPEHITKAENKYFTKNQSFTLKGAEKMKSNINVIQYECYIKATEKQLEGLKWKDKRIYHIVEIKNENLQKEIYSFVDDRCKRLAITTVVGDIYKFDLLVEFLNSKCLELKSITDRPVDDLKRSYKAFLYQKGLSLRVNRSRKDRQTEGKQDSANISYLNMLYSYATEQKNISIPENEKDVWDMRKLDIVPRSNPIRGRYKLDFRDIQQKEFKEIAKKILYSHCGVKAMGSIKSELLAFRRFAHFVYEKYPRVRHLIEIDRNMIEEYLVYIKTETGLSAVSYSTELSVLGNILDEIGRELEIGELCNLFLSSDCKSYDNSLPRAYSDDEIKRFNRELTKLRPQIGRCLIIHQMLGTRIEDTLTLRRDCMKEKEGHFYITIRQSKTRMYTRPISNQLAELINKAIEVSVERYPNADYIFLQDNGKLYTDSILKYHVNILIYENNIKDDNGEYFEFRTHRFRHTFGVKLTEMHLDDDSIARLLGHKDTRSVSHYRRLRNEVLAKDTLEVRNELNQMLDQYREEKKNGKI